MIHIKQINKVTFDEERKQVQNEFAQDFGSSPLVQTTEMGDIMTAIYPKEDDKNIKMLGNINYYEEIGVLGVSGLAEMGVMSKRCQLVAMEKLRLSVSRDARGRNDAVNINQAKNEMNTQSQSKSIAESIGGLFGRSK